jgi:hypothetical protein
MRILLTGLILGALVISGCAHKSPNRPIGNFENALPGNNSTNRQNLTITQEFVLVGKIVTANPTGRFVIVTFPLGRMPANGQRFSVYRQSLKVGEIRITGPQRDDNVVADIAAGDATVGDEVREK